ncbi:KTSC domain-containing protein [Luteimonas cucumeris]|uniref:KTSC domain-containing protein n=1 Tax=Luteimonas cucumeris TaxID=985012 RepID=A0A562L8H9_9GAMM|nr:KTSC domain-containing protein [Luteimonas cucumeris]TWI03774.1 KTSC domain-containing protein [Luteimonas cucumeris]
MRREPVESDALRSVGYDPDRRILEIEFNSGTVYRYFDVPENVHTGLMTAGSHGEFFARHIRDAGFDYEQR